MTTRAKGIELCLNRTSRTGMYWYALGVNCSSLLERPTCADAAENLLQSSTLKFHLPLSQEIRTFSLAWSEK
jgi:hypothetical protein